MHINVYLSLLCVLSSRTIGTSQLPVWRYPCGFVCFGVLWLFSARNRTGED